MKKKAVGRWKYKHFKRLTDVGTFEHINKGS